MSEEALQIAEERREAKGKGEREGYTELKKVETLSEEVLKIPEKRREAKSKGEKE